LVTHRPVWGILDGKEGDFQVENAAFDAATKGSLYGDYGLVICGHIHVAGLLGLDEVSQRPTHLVSGNAGTALNQIPTASPTAGDLHDPAVTQAETFSSFGFMTLEPAEIGRTATQRDKLAKPLLECVVVLDQLTCEAIDGNRCVRRQGQGKSEAGDRKVTRFALLRNVADGSD
jgi:hypothetical protein